MKKKVLAVLLCAAMVMSMTACGNSSTEEPAETADTTEAADDSTEAADESTDTAAAGGDFKIGLVTDVGGVNDGSFNSASRQTIWNLPLTRTIPRIWRPLSMKNMT